MLLLFLSIGVHAASITSLTSGNWSATAWPNTLRTGTLTVLNNSNAVTGTGTLFTTEISVGNIIKTTANAVIGTVASITDNTHLILVSPATPARTGIAYNVQGVGSVDNVTIATGSVLTVDGAYTCASLAFASVSTNSSVTINGANSLTVTGLTSMPNPSANHNCIIAVGAGSLTAGSLTMAGSSTTRYNSISISTGTVTINGTVTTGTTGCQFNFTGAGQLKFGGTFSGGPAALTPSTGTVEYTSTNPVIQAFSGSYYNLTFSGTGTTSAGSGTITVQGDLSNTGGGTLNFSAIPVTFSGTTASQSIDGFTTTGTVSMTKTAGSAVFQGNVNGGALTINGSGGTLNLGAGLTHTFSGTWTRTAGTLDVGSSTLNVGGTLSGTGGVLSAGSGTVNYSRAGTQTLVAATYNNLTLSGSNAKTFPSGTTTVNGILSLEGAASATVTGTLTYGTNAGLQYKTTDAHTAGAEWISPFAGAGGVIIANTAGSVTMGASKAFNANVPLTINNSATLTPGANLLTLGGDFNNAGTFTSGSGGVTIAGTAAIQTIDGFTTTGAVSITKTAGAAAFLGDVNGGAFTLSGSGSTLDLGAGFNHTFTGAWTRTSGTLLGNSSTLNIGGTVTNTAGTFTPGTSTVNYNGASQTIANVAYNNLILSGSNTKTFFAATTIAGNLSISSGVIANLGTFTSSANTMTLGGAGVINGSWGSTSSSAIYKNNTFFAATTGIINISASSCTAPTIALGTNPSVCLGAISANLPYSGTTGTPDKYSIVFNAAALTAGFINVTDVSLSASPIVITVPASPIGGAGTFSATLTVKNGATGCTSGSSAISVTVNALSTPTFTSQPGASVCTDTDVTYTTQAGQTNYIWVVPGVLNTDYSITSGGIGTTTNTVTLKWLTTGSKTVTINYTNANGCSAASPTSSTATTVNARPAPTFTAQAGASACIGIDVIYTTQASQSNYIWVVPGTLGTDYSITSGGIGTSSNTVTLKWLTSGGKTVTINYANASGCIAASPTSSTATTVNPLPAIGLTVGGIGSICSGTGTNITVASSLSGTNYQLRNNTGNVNVGTPVAGTGGTINLPTGNLSSTTTFNVLATIAATSCSAQLTGTATVTINPLPAIGLTLGGTGSVCSGTSTNITVALSVSGTNYQLRDAGNVNVGIPVAGTGGTINLPTGNLSSATTFNVLATIAATSCSAQLTGTATVTINPLPAIGLTLGGTGSVCSGTSTNITVALSVNGTNYQLRDAGNVNVGIPVAGTGGTINLPTGNLSSSNTFNVLATIFATSCSAQLTGTAAVTVNPNFPVSVSIAASPTGIICSGTSVTFTATPTNGGVAPVYQWKLNGTNVGTNSATYSNAALANGNTVICVLTSNATCATSNPATSNTVTMAVNPLPIATYTLTASPSNINGGSNSTLSLSGSETGVNYQLRVGAITVGSAVPGTGSAISFAAVSPSSTTTYNVLATNATTGCSIQQTSTAVVSVCISSQPSDSRVCAGNNTSFSIAASGTFQWQVLIPDLSGAPTWSNLANGGIYSGVATLTLTLTNVTAAYNGYQYRCVVTGGCNATSNAATLSVGLNIGYSLTANPGLINSGGSSTLTLSGSQVGVNYQLRTGTTNIGSLVTGTGSAISFSTGALTSSTNFNVLATGCTTIQITDTRSVIVNETGIIIDLTTCNGQPGLNFFTNSNFGTTTTNNYQIPNQSLFPGVVLGNPLGAYTNYTYGLVSNAIPDGNYVIANSTAGMYRTPQQIMGTDVWLYTEDRSATPGTGQMYIVNAANAPGVFYNETLTNLCENTRYEFSAEMINLYAANWVPNGRDYLNYFPVDGQGNRYTLLPNIDFILDGKVALNTGNIMNDASWKTYGFTFRTAPGQTSIVLSIRNNAAGGMGNDLALDNIIMRSCGPEISLTINTSLPVCPGVPVTMSANLIASDYLTPEYQWQLSTDNGVTWNNISGANGVSYTSNNPAYGDQFRFIVAETTSSLSNPNCSVASNPVSITTTAGISGTTPGSVCGSGTVTLGATANSGSTINWYANLTGGATLGTGASYTTPIISSTTTYYIEATNGGCTSNPRTAVIATVNTSVTASVSISASTGNSICNGTSVTFTATPVNGGDTPSYQWKLNGANVGTNSPAYTTSTIANSDVIGCVMTTSIASCVTGSPATSNNITMSVGTSVSASVNISVNPGNTVCQGTSVTFTAIAINGGATPTYQWKKNGVDVNGEVTNIYTTSSLVQGDVITCVMTTSLTCATGSPASSNGITMTVNPLPAIGLIVGGTASICTGTGTNVTIALSVSGTNYQLRDAGNVNVGAPVAGTGGTVNLPTGNLTTTATFNVLATVGSSSCSAQLLSTKTITVNTLQVATFSYAGTPYCQNAANPSPTYSGGGVAGTFSSTAGLVFVSTATGRVNLAASTAGTYTVTNTIAASGGCGIVTATTSISIIGDRTWTGASNSDWNVSSNWSCNIIPDLTTNVTIPNVLNQPILSNGGIGAANNIVINSGSSLTIVSNTFQIAGTITNSGTFNATAGTIEMKGSSAQTIPAATFATNTIQNLTINNTSGVTLLGPLNVTGIFKASNGNLSSGGNLTLVSTSAQTALIDGSGSGDVTGNVVMQRYLPSSFGYKYFSSPFQGATVSQFSGYVNLSASFPTLYRYDETSISSGWVNYTNSSGTLVPLNGYTVNFGTNPSPVTVSISGVVNNKTQTPITLTNNNQPYTLGFNLVGNPYPSPIDWNASSGWTKTNIDNAIYFFNASVDGGNSGANDSLQYQGTYYSYVGGVSTGGGATNIIPSMQGFFVHVTDGTYPISGSLGVNNPVRINDFITSFKSATIDNRPILRVAANFDGENSMSDVAVIYFDDMATSLFDKNLDALKMMNTDTRVPNLYAISQDSRKLSINGIPFLTDSLTRIPLGIKISKRGIINFHTEDLTNLSINTHVYFEDAANQTCQDVKNNPDYRVALNAGTYENRFSIIFALEGLTAPPPIVYADKFTLIPAGGVWMINIEQTDNIRGILQLVNIQGQVLYRKEVFGNESVELKNPPSSGVYIISLISENKIYSKKIVMQKR